MKTKQNIQPAESMPSTAGNFEQLLANFRKEDPLEFKNNIISRPKPSLTRTERNDKIEKLWDEYTKLVKQEEPQDAKSLNILGDEIIRCVDSIIQLNPKSVNAWHSKGSALSKLGKFEEAIECFDKIIELNPSERKFCDLFLTPFLCLFAFSYHRGGTVVY